MRFDAQQVQIEMKRLETEMAQQPGDPGLVPMELVICRIIGLPDELAEQVGLSAYTEIERTAKELMPTYKRLGLDPTLGNHMAIAFLQGVTFKAAVDELRANTVEGTASE